MPRNGRAEPGPIDEFDEYFAGGAGKARKMTRSELEAEMKRRELEARNNITEACKTQADEIYKVFSNGIERNDLSVPRHIKSDLVKNTLRDLFSTFERWKTIYVEGVLDDDFRKAVLRILHNPGSATQNNITDMDDPVIYQAALLVQDIREQVTDRKDEASKARIEKMAQSMEHQEHEIISLRAELEISKANAMKLQAQTSSDQERTATGILQIENSQLKADLKEASRNAAILEHDLKEESGNARAGKTKTGDLAELLRKARQDVERLNHERGQLRAEVEALKDQEALSKTHLEEQLSLLETDLSGQTKQLEEATIKLMKQDGAITLLKEQKDELEEKWQKKCEKKIEQLAELQRQLDVLQAVEQAPSHTARHRLQTIPSETQFGQASPSALDGKNTAAVETARNLQRKRKVTRACDECSKRHIICDGGQRCSSSSNTMLATPRSSAETRNENRKRLAAGDERQDQSRKRQRPSFQDSDIAMLGAQSRPLSIADSDDEDVDQLHQSERDQAIPLEAKKRRVEFKEPRQFHKPTNENGWYWQHFSRTKWDTKLAECDLLSVKKNEQGLNSLESKQYNTLRNLLTKWTRVMEIEELPGGGKESSTQCDSCKNSSKSHVCKVPSNTSEGQKCSFCLVTAVACKFLGP